MLFWGKFMNRSIKTYDDLLKERQKLEILLQSQKKLIRQDITELKLHLQPAVKAFSFLGKIFTREKNNVLVAGGINHLIDLLFKKIILSRTDWFTRLVVPFFIKNYSSHFVAEHKSELVEKLFSLFRSKHSNGRTASDASGSENI
jgi:hypothetical protein